MRKTLTDKCAETGQIKDWLETKIRWESVSANEGEMVTCLMEIFHTAVICFTGNENSNVNCTCSLV